jgi:hypothetical protein
MDVVPVMASAFTQLAEPDIRCIGCGCTRLRACNDTSLLSPNGACFWVAVDEETGFGLCSRCAVTPIDELVDRMNFVSIR